MGGAQGEGLAVPCLQPLTPALICPHHLIPLPGACSPQLLTPSKPLAKNLLVSCLKQAIRGTDQPLHWTPQLLTATFPEAFAPVPSLLSTHSGHPAFLISHQWSSASAFQSWGAATPPSLSPLPLHVAPQHPTHTQTPPPRGHPFFQLSRLSDPHRSTSTLFSNPTHLRGHLPSCRNKVPPTFPDPLQC